ncbi:MAG: hypothetical protein HUJ95_02230 [Bacteroidales bacterium]|nr:hypothetical protein [Bacteroidales bacterium]
MKTNKIFAALAAITLFVSCEEFQPVFTVDYENPSPAKPVEMTATHTIADVAQMYTNGTFKASEYYRVKDYIVVSGVVSTTDQPGNFYKSLYIQDETGGIEVKIGKNALYNDYLPGQKLYVLCQDLSVGQYGLGSNGNGMIQIGFSDPSGSYETSYLESPIIINTHVFTGEKGNPVTPVVLKESELPGSSDTQKTNKNVGRLVTITDLTYGWDDPKYGDHNEAFVLLYLDSNKDKKASSNRIFISGSGTGITTWAMSKAKMTEYLYSGIWDNVYIGNAKDYNYGTVGDRKGDGTYPTIEKAAGSVSQYFHTPSGKCVQIRTSGFCKFSDTEIDPAVLAGTKKISVTGILCLYQGNIQMVVNNIDDIKIQ